MLVRNTLLLNFIIFFLFSSSIRKRNSLTLWFGYTTIYTRARAPNAIEYIFEWTTTKLKFRPYQRKKIRILYFFSHKKKQKKTHSHTRSLILSLSSSWSSLLRYIYIFNYEKKESKIALKKYFSYKIFFY